MRTAVIIGAGPAGLTAAYELLCRTDIVPVVLEASDAIGGISRTVNYRGNRIDIGGHRFFSKSQRVMQWWLERMPLEEAGRDAWEGGPAGTAASADNTMLLRQRKSRIYFLRQFFDYPIQLSPDTIRKLGLPRIARMGLSYLRAAAFPYKPPENLEQFFINRFGLELYRTFFESYTEKVWGRPCAEISAEWGAQRVKGLSITEALRHFARRLFSRGPAGLDQKSTETSLIEQFLYPKFGPGQMWELVARQVEAMGGQVLRHRHVGRLYTKGNRIAAVEAGDPRTGERIVYPADYFFSTMPVQDLVRAVQAHVPDSVREVSEGLVYRDFITVGLLLNDLKIRDRARGGSRPIRDNWIYIQEPDVRVGRLQVFNNWSPHMVADPSKTWIGLEYFCDEGDDLWTRGDHEMRALAVEELERIGMIDRAAVLDATVLRVPKTYPAYFGAYDRFQEVRDYLDAFPNLFLMGRNGMHRYNNQDHSMLTAMVAVDRIVDGTDEKAAVWAVNTEQEYHEKGRAA